MTRAIRAHHEERLVHSGQHTDDALSRVFFDEMGIPAPDLHLDCAGLGGGARLGRIARAVREDVRSWRPDAVLVYGDTDTTLAGALAARAEGVRLAHVEAGLRSGDRRMPEELNRLAVDHVADLLLCPTESAAENLRRERAAGRVVVTGDVMLDALLATPDDDDGDATLQPLGCAPGAYLVATIHRAANTDDPERLAALLGALGALGRDVVMPCHPRTRGAIDRLAPQRLDGLRLVDPLGRRAMVSLLRGAAGVLTDSGGLQKEAWFLGVPCVTLREETEWTETLAGGWNRLAGADAARIAEAVACLGEERPERDLELFGGGRAAGRVVAALEALVGAGDAAG